MIIHASHRHQYSFARKNADSFVRTKLYYFPHGVYGHVLHSKSNLIKTEIVSYILPSSRASHSTQLFQDNGTKLFTDAELARFLCRYFTRFFDFYTDTRLNIQGRVILTPSNIIFDVLRFGSLKSNFQPLMQRVSFAIFSLKLLHYCN